MEPENQIMIRNALLECASTIPPASFFPAKSPEASELITTDPYAFLIAACLDRGTKAEIIWSIPYAIKQRLGHLDPQKAKLLDLAQIQYLVSSLEYRPRYTRDAPKTIQELTHLICEEYDGMGAKLWLGKRSAEVKRTLMSIYGVGIGIANMTVLLIEIAFLYRFSDLDRERMDIKPDVHTRRVLFRLGVSNFDDDIEAINAARRLNPRFPGELDGPLWWIGRNWCHAGKPNCQWCPITEVCKKEERHV